MNYDIWVATNIQGNANAKSTFFLAIIGDAGQAAEINITPPDSTYNNGEVQNFNGPIPVIGTKVLAVKPRHTTTDGWLISYINVTYNGQLTRHIAGYDWLDGDDNDRRGNPETKEFCAEPPRPTDTKYDSQLPNDGNKRQ